MATVETLLTAEEFCLLPDNGPPTELVRGKIETMNMPTPRHGYLCSQIAFSLLSFVKQHDLGRVMVNDSGVPTEHDPDTVRGADVCYYSFARVPKGPLPRGYLPVAPELVSEVRSPGDRWPRILTKVSEYLAADVKVVCVLDEQTEKLTVYTQDDPPAVLSADDELTLPQVLPGFRVVIRQFLE